MDLQERETNEEELLALILLLLMAQGSTYWATTIPSPASTWALMQQNRTIRNQVDRIVAEAAKSTLEELGVDAKQTAAQKPSRQPLAVPNDSPAFADESIPEDLRRRLPSISSNYQMRLAERISAKHERWLRDRRAAEREGKRKPGLKDLYTEVDRAAEAVTSTTEAVSEAQTKTAKFAKDFLGITSKAIWRLDPRSNSCKTCISLNGSEQAVWSQQFPKGPPAHPNCRCFIDHVIIRSN